MLRYQPAGPVHPNVRIVMDGHRRLEAGETEAIGTMFSPEIAWHEAGAVPPATTYTGIPAVLEFWKRYFGAAGENFRQDIESIMANDEYVTSIVSLAGAKETARYRATAVDVMRIADGLIVEFWRYYEDLGSARAFFQA